MNRSVGRLGAAARAAAFAVLALAALALAVPERAQAQTVTTLVSNTGQGSTGTTQWSWRLSQTFTTGMNTDGYTLSAVEVGYQDGSSDEFAVSVCTVNASGYPTAECNALTPPSVFSVGILEFTTPTGTTINLNASTTYAVLLAAASASVNYGQTTSAGEDSGGAIGWSLANQFDVEARTTMPFMWGAHTSGSAIRIAIKGTVKTTPTTAPRVTSIERQSPSTSPTNANSLTWRVTFDEAVSNVGTADFSVTGTTATLAVTGSGTTYDVTVSGGNLADLDATVTLAFASGQDIEDAAGNALTNTTPTGTNENDYVVDNTAPTVAITGVPDPSNAPFTATFTFSEDVTGFVVGDIGLGNATASGFTMTNARVYTALITPATDGEVTVDVAAGVAEDEAGNDNTVATRARSTYTGSANTPATGAPTGIALSVSPNEVGEGDTATTVTVTATLDGTGTLSNPTTVTVRIGASSIVIGGTDDIFPLGDTATEGTDYQTIQHFDLTIPANARSGAGTFTLTPMQDTVAEGDETITVAGTVDGFTVTGTELTLKDDETAPTEITLTVSPDEVAENDNGTIVTVTATLQGNATLPGATRVSVQIGASSDGATEGTDYLSISDFELTIPGEESSVTGRFRLTPKQDTVAEGDETISVLGTAIGFTVTDTEVTLTDDETSPAAITLSVSPDTVREDDTTGTTVTVTASLEGRVTRSVATTVTVQMGASGDSATEGMDYVEVSDFTVTIPGGMLSGTETFTLTPSQDSMAEGDETISALGTANGFTVTGTQVTIEDDEPTGIALSLLPTKLRKTKGGLR